MVSIILPRLPSNWQQQPVFFSRAWNEAMSKIEMLLNEIVSIPEIQAALAGLDTAVASANTAAANANAAAASVTASSALANSYVTPTNVLSATTTSVTVSANTRVYGDGTSVPVNSGTITGLVASTLYYIYYDDPTRAGGAVTYMATTTSTAAAQVNGRHTVGSITTPTSGTATGSTVRPPGVGAIP